MSADLFAEFGQGSAPAQGSTGRQQTGQASSLIPELEQSGDDFFGAGGLQQIRPQPPSLGVVSSRSAAPAPRQPPGFQIFDIPRQRDSDVLFDATLDAPASEDDDDWGEFEGPESTPQQGPSSHAPVKTVLPNPQPRQDTGSISGTIDLLDSLTISNQTTKPPVTQVSGKKPQPQPSKNVCNQTWDDDSFDDWGDFTDGPPVKKSPSRPTEKKKPQPHLKVKPSNPPPTTWEDDSFDDWADFTDGPSTKPTPIKTKKPSASHPAPGPAANSFLSGTAAPATAVRPTNIPPPSVLMELLQDVLEQQQKEATQARSQQRSSNTTATPPPTTTIAATASAIHVTLQTTARIIAGRSLRWKRDTILSQSMRIGPAHSGKAGGMKLNTVNKNENVKEEQEAVDVLGLWRERAVLFNAVVQAAGLRPVPAVAQPSALKVVTERPEQGALKAAHACALCALKRDERVLRVDEETVQDSFGEYWTDHWGHTACRQFWETNRHLLGQR
ncbi:hypothetical protein NUU61_005164 [Penicillium alfredii]|uniref:Uncharacterized protein n=1 Tax=Penicillium alfredii TaxID=1506179 RepID=A0A9W9F8W3_9EURO|nr:uncharacterized protein NUU61_005164 [Penicillium alfredii]KAJ5095808.1 hypothetical protein NUU61_005164 [Penicillium alfredii]